VELRTIVVVLYLTTAACTQKTPPAETKSAAPPVKITQFYASPENPPKGEKALVCYGVENATEVRLDPPVERVWPASSRCFDFVPSKESALTLTASRGAEQVTQTIRLKPGPAQVKLLQVSINKIQVAPGEQITVCYKAQNAASVTIKPGQPYGPQTPALGCIEDHPKATTTYVLTATGASGEADTEKVTAKVK